MIGGPRPMAVLQVVVGIYGQNLYHRVRREGTPSLPSYERLPQTRRNEVHQTRLHAAFELLDELDSRHTSQRDTARYRGRSGQLAPRQRGCPIGIRSVDDHAVACETARGNERFVDALERNAEIVRVRLLEEHDQGVGGLLRHGQIFQERWLPWDERGNVRIDREPGAECLIGVVAGQCLEEIRLVSEERPLARGSER